VSKPRLGVVIVGGAGIDYSIRGTALPSSSRPMTGDAFLRDVGGKGANQATVVARLGVHSTLIAAVGVDAEGDEVVGALRQEHVVVDRVVRNQREPTACTLICVDTHGRKLTASRPGANRTLSIEQMDQDCFQSAEVILVQLEIPISTALAVARLAHGASTCVVLDASPLSDVPDDLLQLADVISVNVDEAEVLARLQVRDPETAFAAGDAICRRGARSVTIGLQDGRVVVAQATRQWLPHPRVAVVDTTGAGDACAGAIAAALAEHRSVIDACAFGHAAAAIATTQFGARRSLPDRQALEMFLRDEARQ
jgi:ribokinase